MFSLVMNYKYNVPERKQQCQHTSRNKQQAVTGLYEAVWHDIGSKVFQRTIPGTASLNRMSTCIV